MARVQLVEAAHQREVLDRRRTRQIIELAPVF
jgi:hypothetical protein